MPITRRVVLEHVAAASDAERRKTTTITALAARLDTEKQTIEPYLDGLAACELVRMYQDDRVRITITGEELLALDTDELVIVDST